MRLRLAAGSSALAVVLGVACGGRIAGSPGEPVQAEGGAPVDAGPTEARADTAQPAPAAVGSFADDAALPATCCCPNGATCASNCVTDCSQGPVGGGDLNGTDPAAQCELCCSGQGWVCPASCACPMDVEQDASVDADAAMSFGAQTFGATSNCGACCSGVGMCAVGCACGSLP